MPSIQPDQGKFLLQMALPGLEREQKTTQQVLEAVPADKGDYRPHPHSMSAMDLSWHIATAENMFLSAIAAGAFDFSGMARPDSVKTTTDVASWYAKASAANLEKIKNLSGEQLAQTLDFRGFFQMPAVEVINFALRHSVHHRGQLSVYLRPIGAKVPAIYGESYDTAEARKAAQS
jgi:uncharacterized damage-inducible protein DinB